MFDSKKGYVLAAIFTVSVSAGLWVFGVQLVSKSPEIEILKQQNATLTEFIDRQFEWNKTSTAHDMLFDARLDILEQKMRKVYGGYELKATFEYIDNGWYWVLNDTAYAAEITLLQYLCKGDCG